MREAIGPFLGHEHPAMLGQTPGVARFQHDAGTLRQVDRPVHRRRQGDHQVHAAGPVADHHDSLTGKVGLVAKVGGMENLPFKALCSRQPRHPGIAETPGRQDYCAPDAGSLAAFRQPAISCARNALYLHPAVNVEVVLAHVFQQIVMILPRAGIDAEVQRKLLSRHVRIEARRVQFQRGVEAVPGGTDDCFTVNDPIVDARSLQRQRAGDTGRTGANDQHLIATFHGVSCPPAPWRWRSAAAARPWPPLPL